MRAPVSSWSSVVPRQGIGFATMAAAALITSFFYCLPLGRYRVGAFASDFRVYDFVAVGFLFLVGPQLMPRVRALMRDRSSFHYWAMLLIGLLWFSLLLTATAGQERLLPGVIRAFRFTVYFTVGSFVAAAADSPQRYRFLLRIIYLNIAVQAVLALLQGVGLVAHLWPDYWKFQYGGEYPTGTLSPHHKHIGVVMLLGTGLSMTFLRARWRPLPLPVIPVLLALTVIVPIFAGSRTAMLGWGGLVLGVLYLRRLRGIAILAGAGLALALGYLVVQEYVRETARSQFEVSVAQPWRRGGIEEIGEERFLVWQRAWDRIERNPVRIFLGDGFQNTLAAHNNYLHVLLELGLLGLFVYVKFLIGVLKTLRRAYQASSGPLERMVAGDTWAIFVAVLVTMLVGETLWAQYSMFTLSGQIMALVGLAVSPLGWTRETGSAQR